MLRKVSIRLSIATKTPMTHFMRMGLSELAETVEDVKAVKKEE